MALKEESKEILRTAILMQLNAARATGLRLGPIHVGAKLAGFQTLEEEELAKQMRYLEAHGLICRDKKAHTQSVDIYLITAPGVDVLDESGLI
jgi:hypothetical protein